LNCSRSHPSDAALPSGGDRVETSSIAVADLDPVVARLEAANVAVEPIRIDPNRDQRFTFFKDPDGLPLELYEVPIRIGSLS